MLWGTRRRQASIEMFSRLTLSEFLHVLASLSPALGRAGLALTCGGLGEGGGGVKSPIQKREDKHQQRKPCVDDQNKAKDGSENHRCNKGEGCSKEKRRDRHS